MIQVQFHSSYVALQYKSGTKFFHRAVPKLYTVKMYKFLLFHHRNIEQNTYKSMTKLSRLSRWYKDIMQPSKAFLKVCRGC